MPVIIVNHDVKGFGILAANFFALLGTFAWFILVQICDMRYFTLGCGKGCGNVEMWNRYVLECGDIWFEK